jgi:acetyltransferase-like isoleucine patch superfamily enzyme
MTIYNFLRRCINFIERKFSSSSNHQFVANHPHLQIGNSLTFDNFNLNIRLPQAGRKYVTIGNDSMIGGTYTFESTTGEVIIGNRVYFAGGHVICTNKIEIEDDVFLSWGIYLFDNDSHSLDYKHRLTDMQNHLKDWRAGLTNYNVSKDWSNVNSAPIKICRYAWIGMECKILKGVTIGEGAIVGTGSVVTKNVEPWTIVAGNPAKVVKVIPEELRKQ